MMKYLLFSISAILLIGIMLIPDIWAQTSCDFDPQQREFDTENYYTGPLFDEHAIAICPSSRVSGWNQKPSLTIWFNINGIFGFYQIHDFILEQTIKLAKDTEDKYPGRIVTFVLNNCRTTKTRQDS